MLLQNILLIKNKNTKQYQSSPSRKEVGIEFLKFGRIPIFLPKREYL